MDIFIPDNIKRLVADKPFCDDNIGMSQSSVYLFDDMVLKIENHTEQNDITIDMINWMSDKLPVPKVICYEIENGKSYTLMSRIKGRMTCDKQLMEQADTTVSLLADGLKMLWSADISDCPRKLTVKDDLKTAQYYLQNDMVDIDAVDFELLNNNGFDSLPQLFDWLCSNIPQSEYVLSHGDYCMPNVLVEENKISGFIDLGECAVSDKWKDISMCYISLKNNYSGCFGGKVYKDFNPDILFEKLGIEIDADKLKYYILLNELFKTK